MSTSVLLTVEGVAKKFCRSPRRAFGYACADVWQRITGRGNQDQLRTEEFWALKDVSFQMRKGEILGIVGHNGAGKTTLIQVLSGLLLPTLGRYSLSTTDVVHMDHGNNLDLFESGRDNILRLLGMQNLSSSQVAESVEKICDWVQLEELIDAPVGTYSLGMRMRLSFATYAQMNPALFIVDEALYGGDFRFQARFRKYLLDFVEKGGAMLLCSHDLFSLQTLSHRLLLMQNGRVAMDGSPPDVLARYLAPDEDPAPELTSHGHSTTSSMVMIQKLQCGPARSGKDFLVEVECQSQDDYPEITWALEFSAAGHVAVATLKGGYREALSLSKGGNRLRCRIDRLPLAPGLYQLRTALVHRLSGVVLGWKGFECAAQLVEVTAPVDETHNVMRLRKNLVYLEGQFEQLES